MIKIKNFKILFFIAGTENVLNSEEEDDEEDDEEAAIEVPSKVMKLS